MVEKCSLKPDHYSDTSVFYRLNFVTINASDEVRNISSSFGSEPYAGFSNLVFRCFMSWSNGRFSADAWDTLYLNLYQVELQDIERMGKTLKRIRKIEDSWVVRPRTFGQYVALLACGLGIKRYVTVLGPETGMHTTNRHHFGEVKYLADKIDRVIEEARAAKFDPKPNADVA